MMSNGVQQDICNLVGIIFSVMQCEASTGLHRQGAILESSLLCRHRFSSRSPQSSTHDARGQRQADQSQSSDVEQSGKTIQYLAPAILEVRIMRETSEIWQNVPLVVHALDLYKAKRENRLQTTRNPATVVVSTQ